MIERGGVGVAQHVGMYVRHGGGFFYVRVPELLEHLGGHVCTVEAGDDVCAQARRLVQDALQGAGDGNDAVGGLGFQLVGGKLLVGAEGHGPGDDELPNADVRPFQAECFLLAQAAVEAEAAENAGAGLSDGAHQGGGFLVGEVFLLVGGVVFGNLHALGWVGGHQLILPGRLEQLAGRDQDFVLRAFRQIGDTGKHPADMYGADVAQLHTADHGHDVLVVGVAVHPDRGVAQRHFVAFKPGLGPLAHKRVVAYFQAGFILGQEGAGGGVDSGGGFAVYDFLFTVGQGYLFLIPAIGTFGHCHKKYTSEKWIQACKPAPEVVQ